MPQHHRFTSAARRRILIASGFEPLLDTGSEPSDWGP